MDIQTFEPIASQFRLSGPLTAIAPHGSGHINDTYAGVCDEGAKLRRYVFQRINRNIFKDIPLLMDNVARITQHLRSGTGLAPQERSRQFLTLVPTLDGQSYLQTEQGDFWRVYDFIEDAQTFDVCSGPAQAYEAARAFAAFQRQLGDLPSPPLGETIPYFHHAPRRFAALEEASSADVVGRCRQVEAELAFCRARRDWMPILAEALESGRIPYRTTHNDTKLNNVMMDRDTGRALCVIDLDTAMPGSVLFDFGDMMRTFTPTALEDEPDLDKVRMDMAIFDSLARGYGSVAREFLTAQEAAWLGFSGRLITLVIGIRFLTDHLAGDTYFKIHRPDHNLDRARTQFKMVREMEEHAPQIESILKSALQ